jgi:hypothetical protein
VSTLLTYITEDRKRTIMVWASDDYRPHMISLPDGTAARYTGAVTCDAPPEGALIFAKMPDTHAYVLARAWWDDGVVPFPDLVTAKRIRDECETFEELYARIQYALTDEKVIIGWM